MSRRRCFTFGVSLPLWKNCHQTKNATEAMKTTIDTQKFSRWPANSCDGSIRSSSSNVRPKV